MGVHPTNLTTGLRLPKREHRRPRVPTDEECEAIRGAAWTPREKAIIALMLMGGLRRGEVLGLKVEDLSAEYAQILVRGKGHKERVVPLCPALRDLLITHLEVRGVSPGPLFLGRTGQRMTETSFIRLFRRVLKRVGLQGEGITPHKLRHAFGTTLVREGVDVATIAELMGHSNMSTTSVYLHASPTTMRTAVEKLRLGTADRDQSPPPPDRPGAGPLPARPDLA